MASSHDFPDPIPAVEEPMAVQEEVLPHMVMQQPNVIGNSEDHEEEDDHRSHHVQHHDRAFADITN